MGQAAFVFLDRDGVINQERGKHTFMVEDFKWVAGFWDGLKLLQNAGYRFLIISNQSGIAQGFYGHKEVETLNNLIFHTAKEQGVHIEEVFYCPHHPSTGKCLCRKPESLLFEKAIHKYKVNIKRSWMIGDKPRDITPAEKLGLNGLLVEANSNFVQNIQSILSNG